MLRLTQTYASIRLAGCARCLERIVSDLPIDRVLAVCRESAEIDPS
jgi:hypothetical protein